MHLKEISRQSTEETEGNHEHSSMKIGGTLVVSSTNILTKSNHFQFMVRLTKMCLTKTYSKDHINKYLSGKFST
jgi:hypothetical protein